MKHGFYRIAAACPRLHLGDPAKNADAHIRLIRAAAEAGTHVLLFPHLSLVGATAGDLLTLDGMLDAAEGALRRILTETADTRLLAFVGLPFRYKNRILHGCAATLGGVLEAVFADTCEEGTVTLAGQCAPLGMTILPCRTHPELTVAVEFGEGHASPLSPAADLCAQGATVIVNPAARRVIAGEVDALRASVLAHSARLTAAYIRAEAGIGESTTDGVYAGHCLIADRGACLRERAAFAEEEMIASVIDCAAILRDRRLAAYPARELDKSVMFVLPERETVLEAVDPHPIYPKDAAKRAAFCREVLTIQAAGLARRMEAAYAPGVVIGISGGLDSCLALLVAARSMDMLGRPHSAITAISMPCYGTTDRTKGNAQLLSEEIGVSFREIPIAAAVAQHFADIGHDPEVRNVVYENAQARERTQIIMDLANEKNDLVVGTGDLSELALGWATYNGDHMSGYGVNAGVPKTLVRQVVACCADEAEAHGQLSLAAVLRDILATPVSPELLPAADDGEIAQRTEDLVGPYELHDFYLWHLLRLGEAPDKILRQAKIAFAGVFPDEVIEKWLTVFLRRFRIQQFKRSCLPDGPQVLPISLSPRGGWRMPSDAEGMGGTLGAFEKSLPDPAKPFRAYTRMKTVQISM